MKTLTILLAAIGIVWILKDSYILSAPRKFISQKSKYLQKLFACSQCLGFWVGFLFSLYLYKAEGFSLTLILLPFMTSAFCWFTDSLLDLIQESTVYFNKKNN